MQNRSNKPGHAVGIDIGTTTISAVVVVSSSGILVRRTTIPNSAALAPSHDYEKCQNAAVIAELCATVLDRIGREFPEIDAIGMTGQMHGIVYVDAAGKAVSPLISWQDGRGDLPFERGLTFAQALSETTGYSVATGFGMTTHFWMTSRGEVPAKATAFCTIGDFVTMRLSRQRSPVIHATNAASLGLFDLAAGDFDRNAILAAGMDPGFLPKVVADRTVVGRTVSGVPVTVAIGDNQASVLGSVHDRDAVLVNVGTGSQISRVTTGSATEPLELRPFFAGQLLCVGSALAGGSAYAAVKRFFEQTFGAGFSGDLYAWMNAQAADALASADPLVMDTRFQGTRTDAALRGSLTNIGIGNFTPGQLCLAALRGIVDELFEFYRHMPPGRALVGSGNGVRNNPLLQRLFTERFGLPLSIPEYEEEAAYGAGLFALTESAVPE
jgi:sedoheptulokinase